MGEESEVRWRVTWLTEIYKAFRHVETLFFQGRNLYLAGMLLVVQVLFTFRQPIAGLQGRGFYLGWIKFVHVKRHYSSARATHQRGLSSNFIINVDHSSVLLQCTLRKLYFEMEIMTHFRTCSRRNNQERGLRRSPSGGGVGDSAPTTAKLI